MNRNLSGHQFTAYRGVMVGTGRAPETDEEVLAHLRPNGPDGTAYGKHWSTDPEVAKQFVSNQNAGGYETLPARMRKFDGPVDRWGVVLEGQAQGLAHDQSAVRSAHEREVGIYRGSDHPAANNLQSVRAHVYDMPSRETIAKMLPLGEPGTVRRRMDMFKSSMSTPVRSFDIPEEHWRP